MCWLSVQGKSPECGSLTMYQSCWRKGDSSEVGSLMTYRLNSKTGGIYKWCTGRGSGRSEWG
jgi:hypothetical protein